MVDCETVLVFEIKVFSWDSEKSFRKIRVVVICAISGVCDNQRRSTCG